MNRTIKIYSILFMIMGVLFIIFWSLDMKLTTQLENKEKVIAYQQEFISNKMMEKQQEIDLLKEENERLKTELEIKTAELDERCVVDMSVIEPLKEISPSHYLIKYKEICNEYADCIGLPDTIYDVYTTEEIMLIQQVVETETYGQDFKSKVNVANVILNRINSNEFPNTVVEVIESPNQFSFWRNSISEDTILAVEYAFLFEDTTNGALYFHSNDKLDFWNGYEYIFTDNAGHHFY